MKNNKLRGTGIAMVTPFTKSGQVDVLSLEKLVNFVIDGGVNYIVVLGTTAESATLTKDEKELVKKTITGANAGRVPLVLGLGGNNTQEVVREIEKTDFSDFCAILSVCPYYNKPSQEGIFEHFSTIASACPIPVILYNVPGRTGVNMSPQTTIALSKCQNIIGIKEASGNVEQFMRIVQGAPSDFLVISGDDMTSMATTLLGGDGVISVIGQAIPHQFSKMIKLALDGSCSSANALQYKLMDSFSLIFKEGNPVGIKAMLSLQGICSPFVRLPLVKASDSLVQSLRDFLNTL